MLGSGSLCTLNDLFSDYIESEFMAHLNDAQEFCLMRQKGVEFEFSVACVLLGDKIYQDGGQIMALYTVP